MMLSTRVLLSSLLLVPLTATVGCGDKQAQQNPQAKKEVLPQIKVELPASPNFSDARAPEKHPDGSYSIFGLRSSIDERVKEGDAGTEIWVSGYVQEIYVPPECPEGELCPPAKQPHFWITDKPGEKGKKRAMMVVNYRYSVPEWEAKQWKGVQDVVVEVGKQYQVKGKFKRFSDTGFAHDNGLLDFVSYKDADQETGEIREIYPVGSPVHPQTIAAQEEQNKKMQERMAKDARKFKK